MMKRMIDNGSAYVPKGFDYQTDFGTAKAAFVQESSTGRPFFVSSFKQPITWSLSNIPQKDPAKAATVQYGANIAIFKSTPEKQLASMAVREVVRGRRADRRVGGEVELHAGPQDRAGHRHAQERVEDRPQGKQAFDLIGTSVPEPNVRGQQDIRTVIEDMLNAVVAGKVTDIPAAVKAAGVKANQILKDNQ